MPRQLNKKKLVSRLKKYSASIILDANKFPDFNRSAAFYTKQDQSKHVKYMIEMIIENVYVWPDHRINRWLGFLQGTMWSLGLNSLNDFRDDVREILDDGNS